MNTNTNPEPTVDIAVVHPEAIRVDVADMTAGDVVFDVFGGTSSLVKVRPYRDGSVTITHTDGRREWLAPGPITIRREARPMTTTPTTPQAVSRALRAGGVTPVASRSREGVRVARSALGRVCVTVDIDGPRARERMTEDVTDILDAAGYVYERTGGGQWLYVTGRGVTR